MTTRGAAETALDVDGGRLHLVPGRRDVTRAPGEANPPAVVLLHGAGSGTRTPVLTRLAALLETGGVTVGRLEMPYRVAGRRAPDRPARLDAVLAAAVEALGAPGGLALAGASMGSRVAVRTARAVGACGVVALGFPLHPPGDRPSRHEELAGAGVPVLVVQGERDAFGRPEPDPGLERDVVVVAGADHSFKVRVKDGRTADEVADEAAGLAATWLLRRLGRGAG